MCQSSETEIGIACTVVFLLIHYQCEVTTIFQNTPHIKITLSQKWWTRRPHYFVTTHTHTLEQPIPLFTVCSGTGFLKKYGFSPSLINVLKLVSEFVKHISMNLQSQKNMGIMTLVALIAHHTSTLSSSNGTSWINMWFSTDKFILYWEFICPLKWNQTFSLHGMSVGFISPAFTPWRSPFTKYTLPSWFVL